MSPEEYSIFLVVRDGSDGIDYDEYDSFVVVAQDETTARHIHPSQYGDMTWSHKLETWVNRDLEPRIYHSWTNNIEALEVTYIGVAGPGMTPGMVICSSFNAG